jgi:hypothetical protein
MGFLKIFPGQNMFFSQTCARAGATPGSVMLKLVTGYVVTHTLLSLTTKMVNVVLTDGKEDAHLRCPKCNLKPSATLLNDPDQATLPSQQQAIKNFRIAEAA